MSVLLVFPGPPKDAPPLSFLPATHPPLGICYLSSFLRSKDVPVNFVDLNFSSIEDLKNDIRRSNAQIVGFSVTTHTFYPAYETAKEIKKTFPFVKIVFGGNPVELFKDYLNEKIIDIIVLGRGEETLYELSRLLLYDLGKLSDIPDIMFLRSGEAVRNIGRKDPLPLDSLPFPDRESMDLQRYLKNKPNKQCYIVTSRYCPFKCNFCISGTVKNDFCMRSVENVMSEIREIKKKYPFYNKIHFVDETFNVNKKRTVDLCNALKEVNVPWSANFRFDQNMDEELLELMKDSGAVVIETGIESASQEILDKLNKQIDISYVEKMLEKAAELEIPVLAAFIVPNFCDTPETLEQTVSFIDRAAKQYIVLPISFPVYLHPGTVAFEKAKEYGTVTNSNFDLIKSDRLSQEQITKALFRTQALFVDSLFRNAKHLKKLADFPVPDIENLGPANISMVMDQLKKFNPGL